MECKTPGPVLKSVGGRDTLWGHFQRHHSMWARATICGPHLTQCDCKWKKSNPNRKWGWLLLFCKIYLPLHNILTLEDGGGCLTCVKFVGHSIPLFPFPTLPCFPINLKSWETSMFCFLTQTMIWFTFSFFSCFLSSFFSRFDNFLLKLLSSCVGWTWGVFLLTISNTRITFQSTQVQRQILRSRVEYK